MSKVCLLGVCLGVIDYPRFLPGCGMFGFRVNGLRESLNERM